MNYELMMNGNVRIGEVAPDFEARTRPINTDVKDILNNNNINYNNWRYKSDRDYSDFDFSKFYANNF